MNKENSKRYAEKSREKIFEKLETDYKELDKISDPEELSIKIKNYESEKSYEKEFDELESFIRRNGLEGIVHSCRTVFNDKRIRLFIKLKKKHGLLPKKDKPTYQTFEEEVIEQNTYTCAECFQDKTGLYLSCKDKNDDNKLCSKKCFQEYYGEICNECTKSRLEFHRNNDYPNIVYCSECWKKRETEEEQEWNPTIYCRYCSIKTEIFDVCEKGECLTKMNKEIEDKKNKNNEDDNQESRIKQQISNLESIPNRTAEQESKLTSKKQELKELEKKLAELENQQNQNQKPKNSGLGWKIGVGVLVGVGLVGLVTVMVRRKNRKN